MPKHLTVWITVNYGKFLKRIGKGYVKAIYCHPAYLVYMQSTSCEILGWMKHKLESRLLGEISVKILEAVNKQKFVVNVLESV